ncbi:MAG: hypothetical protein VB106_19355 [Clostridiaceae bacterium]|nr:hypothetical protein [Clostridiaceae bacterium]
MNNAAIIIFRRSTLPKVLKFFTAPRINQVIDLDNAGDSVRVYIIECPVMKYAADNRKLGKSLYRLCIENNVGFFIGKNIEYYMGSGLEHMENRIERGDIDEIKAVKGLAALIKLSVEKGSNLLKKNMCFIGESHVYQYINTMLEEAAGVFIYEHEKMDNDIKKRIFERLMSEKGISAVFTKDLNRAISQCDIILADDGADIEAYKPKMYGKILIGDNPAKGDFEKIDQVLLWYESLKDLPEDDVFIRFNDELLGILRHFYKERNPIDFIRRFPYIYCG